ncbi:MAG: ATP-binding domain-containing protein, partial [Sinomicrobium sp.]|nr:ATP-binding domain-containing protein [Sinomicrobium sp.]
QNEEEESNSVSMLTMHAAKGLEFPYVYIVGMEEDLFPSAMNMSTRAELEEERRLFYVALTRAEKQAFLTYAENRYRWGRLNTAEPSRFIEEIDARYVENLSGAGYRYTPVIDAAIFENGNGTGHSAGRKPTSPAMQQTRLRKLTDTERNPAAPDENLYRLSVGMHVEHSSFGRGEVISVEDSGNNKKAEIRFENGQQKKLLLRFARLKIID